MTDPRTENLVNFVLACGGECSVVIAEAALRGLTSALPPAQEVSTLDDADLAIVEFIDEHSVGCETVTMPTSHWERLSVFLRAFAPVKQKPQPSDWRKIDYDEPATYPTSGTRVLFVGTGAFDDAVLCLGEWDTDRERWFDVETDGDNDRIEFAPGEVTHWRPLPPLPGAAIQAMGEATRTGEALGMARERVAKAARYHVEFQRKHGRMPSPSLAAAVDALVLLLERETAGGK